MLGCLPRADRARVAQRAGKVDEDAEDVVGETRAAGGGAATWDEAGAATVAPLYGRPPRSPLSTADGHPRRAHRARVAERAGEVDEDAEDDVVQSVKPSDETGDNEDDAEEEDLDAAEENSS